MAAIFLESGTDATQSTQFYSGTVGSVASTTSSRTGPRALRFATTGTPAEAYATRSGVLADAGRRINYAFNPASLPSTGVHAGVLVIENAAGEGIFVLSWFDTGFLDLAIAGGAGIGTGTHALSAATWNRVTFSYTITNTTTWAVKIYVNGVIDINVSNAGTLARVSSAQLRFGWFDSGFGVSASKTGDYDDLYIDNTADLTDPGDIRVTAKLPGTVNNNNFDTDGGNGAVNERPISETNYKQQAGATQVDQDYTLQGADVGDVTIGGNTLVARTAWVWAKGTAGGAGPAIINNGSTAAKTLTASPALYTDIVDSASYPSNAAGIGLRSSGTADDTFLYECGMLIAFVGEPTQGAPAATLMGAICM